MYNIQNATNKDSPVVLLPLPTVTYADHSCKAYSFRQLEHILLSLGYSVKYFDNTETIYICKEFE